MSYHAGPSAYEWPARLRRSIVEANTPLVPHRIAREDRRHRAAHTDCVVAAVEAWRDHDPAAAKSFEAGREQLPWQRRRVGTDQQRAGGRERLERPRHPLTQRPISLIDQLGAESPRQTPEIFAVFRAARRARRDYEAGGMDRDCLGERVANERVGQRRRAGGSQCANQSSLGVMRNGLAAKYDQRWPRLTQLLT